MTQEATLDELLAKKPATSEAYIIVDSDIAERWRELQARADRVRWNESELKTVTEEIEELRPAVEAAERVIRFRALGNREYEELRGQKEYLPTPKQRKDARDNGIGELSHNPETFPPALIAASAIAPQFTLEQAQELWTADNWSNGELTLLFLTANSVNAGSQIVSLGKESERTRN